MKRYSVMMVLALLMIVMWGCGEGGVTPQQGQKLEKDGLKAALLTARDLRVSFDLTREGQQMMNEGKLDEAMDRFEESLKVNPVNSHAYIGIAEVHIRRDRGEKKADKEKPENKVNPKALEALDKGLELDPGNSFILQHKGTMLMKAENYEEALGAFQKALNEEPDNVRFLYAISMCHDKMGNPDKADGIFEEAIKNSPDNFEIYQLYARNLRSRVQQEKEKPAKVELLRKLYDVIGKEAENYQGDSKFIRARYDYQLANSLHQIWEITDDPGDKETAVKAFREYIEKYKDKQEGYRQAVFASKKLEEITGEKIQLPDPPAPRPRPGRPPAPGAPRDENPDSSDTN